jgi:hypothetical protein
MKPRKRALAGLDIEQRRFPARAAEIGLGRHHRERRARVARDVPGGRSQLGPGDRRPGAGLLDTCAALATGLC